MKALVLAGGFPQIALIRELHERGVSVVLADYNEKPVAKSYADIFYRVSTLDVDAIKRVALQEQVDFLITVCTDQALLTVAKVSEELNLPCYIDYETALKVTNKRYMKRLFAENDIPSANHVVLEELSESAIKSLKYPLIVKPVDCNSSKGVRKCRDANDLSVYFAEAVTLSRTHTAVIEEYIDGIEVSVDVYVEDGKANILCISNSEKISDQDKFVIFRAIWPVYISERVIEQIKLITQKIACAFKINNSPMLIQLLVDKERVYVIECSARTGGGVKHLLIRRTSGFDVVKAVVDLTMMKKPHFEKNVSQYNYVINDFVYCRRGIFDHLEGFNELLAEDIIVDFYLFKSKGASFDSICASGDRIAGYTIVGKTTDELIKKHNEVRQRIKVISSEGFDMARHDLLTGIYSEKGYLFSEKV